MGHGDGITQDAAVPRSCTPQLPAAALPWNALSSFPKHPFQSCSALWEGAGVPVASLAGVSHCLGFVSLLDQEMGKEAQAGGPSKLLVVQQHIPGCGKQQGAGGSSRAVSHSSRAAFAWQAVSSFQLQAAHWWLPQPLSPRARASSKRSLLLPGLGRRWRLGVNIYVARAFLPLPCIFSPS